MKVKMLSTRSAYNLERFINEELDFLKNNEVIDIKYAIDNYHNVHYAMIIYK
ncbi:hypothetical protein [Macrococcus capreoli]|uniref:hypothetical protein n=1 Tax=Macrococcus capreoli TaxID=2982690 RepID=UPI003EE5DBCE